MTDERKIKLLRAAVKRALWYLPYPVAKSLQAVLDSTK